MDRPAALPIVLGLAMTGTALGQAEVKLGPTSEPMPAWVASQIDDPDDPRVKAYAARQKVRVQLEQELRKIRAEHFRNIRNTSIRQAGIVKLRGYTDPVIFPSLLSLFEREGDDVRGAILDHLADQQTPDADTTLAWAAVFDDDAKFRAAASDRLLRRLDDSGDVSFAVKSVVAEGLRRSRNHEIAAAAQLAQTLQLVEAIPMMINAQISGQTVGSGGGGEGSLAWILVGTQQAFVADLTPVVGDNAVAFDPQIGVVTEGVVLRVIDAAVVTYRVEVHNALVGLSSRAWGQSTAPLGWDNGAWHRWYKDEFRPYLAAKETRDRETARKAPPAATPQAPVAGEPGPG